MDNRTVHGINSAEDADVVRYGRTGKWYLEPAPSTGRKRRQITVQQAAYIAATGTPRLDRPGGKRFDVIVRRLTASPTERSD